MTKSHAKRAQEVSAAEAQVDDAFDTMMSALDWFFHVTTCHEHTNAERAQAYRAAREGFRVFVGDDPTMDAAANAPTTTTVN